jgi:hypothetical protein
MNLSRGDDGSLHCGEVVGRAAVVAVGGEPAVAELVPLGADRFSFEHALLVEPQQVVLVAQLGRLR